MSFWEYERYETVGEKRAKAARKLEQIRRKNPGIAPVFIDGRAIATTWWGKSWNANLERYADYSNRIGRGRSYVRHGAVLDLQIDAGEVQALVQGRRSKPYAVTIKIQGMSRNAWKDLTRECAGQLDSLQELLSGKFPKALGELFMARGTGMFPAPKEIAFSCSCPDWADMCKHVAAALYGIGARLDEAPALFFKLRKVDVQDLVSQAVQDNTRSLLDKAGRKSKRVLDDADLSDVFGIDMDDDFDAGLSLSDQSKRAGGADSASRKARAGKKTQNPKAKAKRGSPGKSREPQAIQSSPQKGGAQSDAGEMAAGKPAKMTVAETVFSVIKKSRSRKGVDTAALVMKTGLSDRQVWSAVAALKKQGRVKSMSRGFYIKA